MGVPDSCTHTVEQELGIRITSITSLGSGDTSATFIITSEKSQSYCLKWSRQIPHEAFLAEAKGLQTLYRKSALIIPEVLTVFSSKEGSGIVLELLMQVPEKRGFDVELAIGLAELHQNESGAFGFTENNFIGRLPQKNTQYGDQGAFFAQERLQYQIEIAAENGWLDGSYLKKFERDRLAIEDMFNESKEPPVLLHGDLWRGNVIACDRGPALIDPAVYFGNREAEIAFTEMFGGFSSDFYREYNKRLPLEKGYERRKEFYNLYHILNHANMFGGHYCDQARAILRRLPS